MITELDVYTKFVKARAEFNNRGYRLPKDWVKYYTEKLTKKQQDILLRMSKYFTTVWCDIDMEKYFECGLELYPRLNYHLFFNKNIMELYKRRDKLVKNEMKNIKTDVISSVKFVCSITKNLNEYCKLIDNNRHVIIDHYLKNKVSAYFVCWMIAEGYFEVYPNGYDMVLPDIMKNYRTMFIKLEKNKDFLNKIKDKIKG